MILVFHSRNFRDSSAFGLGTLYTPEDALRAFNIPSSTGERDDSGYEFVASVATDDLDKAYSLTNHICRNWRENDEVDTPPGIDPRSSSIGDIFVTETEIHIVDRIGFEKLADLTPASAVFNARQHRSTLINGCKNAMVWGTSHQ